MRPLREKLLVQIEITNACTRECTNCSRFVGHYSKPYFMELEIVEQAILSLLDFPGLIGIMGGEPTLHPYFVEICTLVRKHVPPEKRNLMTAGFNWDRYEKVIKRTFGEQVVFNNHSDPTQKHHPMLLSISDVVDNRRYVESLISQCWVDQRWGASINPKGCFFCEIAAAMDLLFDGPGGLPIEKGWWKKEPAAFLGQQRQNCYRCGASVPFYPGKLEDHQDVVSESNYRRLVDVDSPKVRRGRVKVVREKIPEAELARLAENWRPWSHFGEKQREGAGKSQLELYGPFYGWLLKNKWRIRKNFWTFRRLEILLSRWWWRLGGR